MLDEELDLPYLDAMEREYAKAFRAIAPQYAPRCAPFRQRAQRTARVPGRPVRKVLHDDGGKGCTICT